MSDVRYLNFPISYLSGFMNDSRGVLEKILVYNIFLEIDAHNKSSMLYCYDLEINDHGVDQKFVDMFNEVYDETIDEKFPLIVYKSMFNKLDVIRKQTYEMFLYIKNTLENVKWPLHSSYGITFTTFDEYLNENKTDFDKACLLAHIAIRSILSNSSYKKITNLFILSRMDGKVNCVNSVGELSPEIQRYAKEYWMKRIKDELYDKWKLKYYSFHARGCYYSYKMSLKQLVRTVEMKKATKRAEIQHQEYLKAVAAARKTLLEKPNNKNKR